MHWRGQHRKTGDLAYFSSMSLHNLIRPYSLITVSINSESLKQNENIHAYIPKEKEAAQGFYKTRLTVTFDKDDLQIDGCHFLGHNIAISSEIAPIDMCVLCPIWKQ